jgi:uncharacterized protein YkwD
MACPASLAAALAALGLAGCAAEPPRAGTATFYESMAQPGAEVDSETARAMISAYRRNQGLGIVALDPDLQAIARDQAEAMAASGKPTSADTLKAKLRSAGYAQPGANVSAGYHTLPEAFSGWRESPQHNRVLLDPKAARLGIATAYAPGSKYKVYWVLVTAAGKP